MHLDLIKLKKIIVPIVVQDKYTPDYWLERFVKDFSETRVNLNTIENDVLELNKKIQLKAKNVTEEITINNKNSLNITNSTINGHKISSIFQIL